MSSKVPSKDPRPFVEDGRRHKGKDGRFYYSVKASTGKARWVHVSVVTKEKRRVVTKEKKRVGRRPPSRRPSRKRRTVGEIERDIRLRVYPQGATRDFTLSMGCQRGDEYTCGYWSVAQIKALDAAGKTEDLLMAMEDEASLIVDACPTTFLSLNKIKESVEAHPSYVVRMAMVDKGVTFCTDIRRLIQQKKVRAAVICDNPAYCYERGCVALPPALEGVQSWVVLSHKHWFAAITDSRKGVLQKVVAMDSLGVTEVRAWDRCKVVRKILRRIYRGGKRVGKA